MFLTEASDEIIDAMVEECDDMDDAEFEEFCEAVEYNDDLSEMLECAIIENEALFESVINMSAGYSIYESAFDEQMFSLYESAILNERTHYRNQASNWHKSARDGWSIKDAKDDTSDGRVDAEDFREAKRNDSFRIRDAARTNRKYPTQYGHQDPDGRKKYLESRRGDMERMHRDARNRTAAKSAETHSKFLTQVDRENAAKPKQGRLDSIRNKVSSTANRAKAAGTARYNRAANIVGTKAHYLRKDAKAAAQLGAEEAVRIGRDVKAGAQLAAGEAKRLGRDAKAAVQLGAEAARNHAKDTAKKIRNSDAYLAAKGTGRYAASVARRTGSSIKDRVKGLTASLGRKKSTNEAYSGCDPQYFYDLIVESCDTYLPDLAALMEAYEVLDEYAFDSLLESIENDDDINFMVESSLDWFDYIDLFESYDDCGSTNPFLDALAEAYESGEVDMDDMELNALAEAIEDQETMAVASDMKSVSSGAAVASDIEHPEHGEEHDQDEMGRMTTGNKIAGWGTGGAGSGSKNESYNPFLVALAEAAESGEVELDESEEEALADAIDEAAKAASKKDLKAKQAKHEQRLAKFNGISVENQKKANAYAAKVMDALDRGDKEAAGRYGQQMMKYLEKKEVKKTPTIIQALRKWKNGLLKGKKAKNESFGYDEDDALIEAIDAILGDDDFSDDDLDEASAYQAYPEYRMTQRGYNESYSFDDLRTIAEGCGPDGCGPNAPSMMHKEAMQMGTAHGGAGFRDWKDDSCPYTGEPEPNDNFPMGGS
ncbi:MAG: hypothetical protein K2F99_03340 [Muribaculaceae bacterium]|nr:hypothetical protein [Muribaculaceae bacterium]